MHNLTNILLVLSFLVFTGLSLQAQPLYHIIDGDNCDENGMSGEWGPSDVNDPVGDSDAAGSDLVNYWFDYDPDTDNFCFAFERFSTQENGPTATYVIYFDLDCDATTGYDGYGQGGEIAIGLEWKVNGPWEVIQFTNGENGTTVLGNAYVGESDCGDPLTEGQFAEFCFTLGDLLVEGYDPCSCNAIGTPGVVTLAGGNITSQVKDNLEGLIDVEIQVNEVPIADASMSPYIVCLGEEVFYDGSASSDPFPANDVLTYAWDFSYDGAFFNEESSVSIGSYLYDAVGVYDVMFQVEDTYGCPDTLLFQVTVVDEPTAVIDLVIDTCGLTISYDGSNSIDETDPSNLVYGWDFGNGQTSSSESGTITYDDCGSYTIALTVVDPDGLPSCNTHTTTETITFDNIAPTMICPDFAAATCEIDSIPPYTTIEEFTAAGGTITDNCSIDAVVLISESFDGNSCGGSLFRVYFVTDACGNTASCSQEITINDTEGPTITCPDDFYAMCDLDEVPVIDTYFDFIDAGGLIEDDCGFDENSFTLVGELSDGASCPETIVKTYSITDDCGNISFCDFTVIFGDTIQPVFIAPASVSAICDYEETDAYDTIEEFVAAGGTISDNCQLDSSSFVLIDEISNGMTCPETVERIYEIQDMCGNSVQVSHSIIVDDNIVPTITCPINVLTDCDIDQVPPYLLLSDFTDAGGVVDDNCGINELSFTLVMESTDSLSCPETISRIYSIADLCGNTSSCTQLIVVDDDDDPDFSCPAGIVTQCSINDLPAYDNLADFVAAGGFAEDFCGLNENSFALLSEVDNGEDCPKIYTRTYSILDLCGNLATCEQTVTIDDTQTPVMTCPSNLTAVCDIDEQVAFATYAEFISAGGSVTDNCGINEASFVLQSEISNAETCPEVIERTYYVEDLCGNEIICTQLVTVDDQINPIFNNPGDLTGSCEADEHPAYQTFADYVSAGGVASDNCTLVESSFALQSESTNGQTCPLIITRVYEIFDQCDNISTFTQVVTIDDDVVPTITCPGDLTAVCDIDEVDAYLDLASFLAAGGFVSDNCEIDSSSFILQSEASNGLTCPETVTRIYAIEDVCGNISTCTQLVVINDTENPEMTCPAALTAICSVDEQVPYSDFSSFESAGGSATDNCSIDEASFGLLSEVSDGNTCPETFTRTYVVSDLCGNTVTCTQVIVLNDEELPTMTCPAALTAVCSIDEQAPYGSFAEFITAGGSASDNCEINESSFVLESETSDGNTCPEVITRIYYVEDLCGNSVTCEQTIEIDDEVNPVLTAPADLTAVCSIDEQVPYASYAEFVAAGGSASDNCEIDESTFVLQNESSNGMSCPETITRTYYIEDLCGNSITTTQEIVVDDEEAPSFVNPGDLSGSCSIDEHAVYTSYSDFIAAGGTASDNCTLVEASFALQSSSSNSETCPEIITRIYVIADQCGNESTFSQIITIDDEELPVITCPEALSAVCSIDEVDAYSDLASFESAGGSVSDNCEIVSSTFALQSEVSDGASCPETVTRTYEIQDACGNVATCTQEIIINDEEAPTMSCPGNLTAICSVDEQIPYADFATFVGAGGSAADNCEIDEVTFALLSEVSDGNTCPETFTRTYVVADLCGNTITCTQEIVLNDVELPELTCPGDLIAVCDIDEQPAYTDYADFIGNGGSATDNCEIDELSFVLQSEVSDGNTCPEVITRVYYVEDLCGNSATCEQLITINDEVNPELTSPADLTGVCDIDEQPSYTDYASFLAAGGSASDNCEINESSFVLQSEVSDGNTCPETFTRTYYIEDLCGNSVTSTQEIIINDEEFPLFDGPGDLTGLCNIDEHPAYTTFGEFTGAGGTASDNCTLVETSFALQSEVSDGNTCPEIFTRIYEIQDQCGNLSTYTQIVTINDDLAPEIVCPGDLTAVCSIDEVPAYSDLASFEAAGGTVSDNCEIMPATFILQSEVSDGVTCPETITRVYAIEDACGNLSTCTQLIEVNDLELPEMTCPAALTAICSPDEQPAYADFAEFISAGGTANDNCEIDEATFALLSEVSDGNICPETFTRVYVVADLCGNTITCEQDVVLNDTELPTMTCPAELTAICDIDEQPAYPDFASFIAEGGSASDNCEINEDSFIMQSETSDGLTCPETVTRVYYVEDLCGNAITCEHVIVINDEESPVINCPSDLTASCSIDEQMPYGDFSSFLVAGGSASDNCGIDEASFALQSETSDGVTCPEIITRIYSIADLCGNVSTCTQIIEVNDEVLPIITSPGDLEGSCSIDEHPVYSNFVEFTSAGGSASDNCTLLEDSFTLSSEASDNGSCPETITRIYQIEDQCGNVATFEQIIEVNDLVAPVITCPSDLNAICDIAEVPEYTSFAEFVGAGGAASDNCEVDETSFVLQSETSDASTCPETVTRIYAISDLCGNVSTCSQEIVIQDDILPTMSCPGELIAVCSADEQVPYASYSEFIGAGGTAADNCAIDEDSFNLLSENSDGNTCPETITRVYEVTDLCGNATTCEQIVVVNDLVAPEINCPADLQAVCEIDEQPAYLTYADFIAAGGSASDNCDIDQQSFKLASEESDGNTCPETITRIYEVADLCGNLSTCSQLIVVNDEESPIFLEIQDINLNCTIGELPPYEDYEEFIADGNDVTDNCGLNEVSFMLLSEVEDSNDCPKIYTRTYQIQDICGNLSQVTQEITVLDETPPEFIAPANIDHDCIDDVEGPFTSLEDFIAGGGTASDNCEILAGSFTLVSENIIGNTCPLDFVRIYSVSDLCGNESTVEHVVSYNDSVDPLMNCPGGLTAVCSIDEHPAYDSFAEFVSAGGTASDNCALNEASFKLLNQTSNNWVCPETVTRVYEISDDCGNTATCEMTVYIYDGIDPVMIAPASVTAVCSPAEITPYDNLADFIADGGSATDNCEINESSFEVIFETTDGNTCPEVITRVYVVKDKCGNETTATQDIIVNDIIAPVFTEAVDIIIDCDINTLPPFANVNEYKAAGGNVTDNCEVDTKTFEMISEESDGNTCPETITRTYVVADLCGNEATVEHHIILNDEIAPTLICPPTAQVECDIENAPPFASYAEYLENGGSVVENCEINESTFALVSEVSDGNTCPETVTRTYEVADMCGNIGSCTHTLIITDLEPPVFTGTDVLQGQCTVDDFPVYETVYDFLADGGILSDNCGIDSTSFELISEINSDLVCPKLLGRIYRIEDLCGNFTIYQQSVLIDDTIEPEISCPPTMTAVCSVDEIPVINNYDEFIAAGGEISDNCQVNELSFEFVSEEIITNTCPILVNRTYYIEDMCGNSSTCIQELIVHDTVPPSLGSPPDDFGSCSIDEEPVFTELSEWLNAGGGANDNCGLNPNTFMLVSETSNGFTCPEIFTRVYSIADQCGNVTTSEHIIKINDILPPEISCPPSVDNICSIEDNAPVFTVDQFLLVGGTLSDNCGIDESTFELVEEVISAETCPQTISRVYGVADFCGNYATCSQVVTVNDNEAPVITACPADITLQCNSETNEAAILNWLEGFEATDNCGILSQGNNFTDPVGPCEGTGTTTVEFTVVDFCDNITTCSATLTIIDTIPPTADEIPDLIIESILDIPFIDIETVTGETDLCDPAPTVTFLIEETISNASCSGDNLTIIRTYVVADCSGNTSTVTETIYLEDDPMILDTESTDIDCKGDATGTISLSVSGGNPDYSYDWSDDLYDGMTELDDLTAGTYTVTVTDEGGCTKAKSVTINEPADGLTININPSDVLLCEGDNVELTSSVLFGEDPITYSWTYNNESYDSEDITVSEAGIYYLEVTDGNGCVSSDSAIVSIIPGIVLDPIGPLLGCESVILPAITGTNLSGNAAYYTQSGGNGTSFQEGDEISITTDLFIYDETDTNPSCPYEIVVSIILNDGAIIDNPGDQVVCDQYILGEISGTGLSSNVNYFTEANGQGEMLNAGDVITENMTIYIFDEGINCPSETSFDVEIITKPEIDPIDNVISCDIYTLPEITGENLTGNEAYYSGPNGSGTVFQAGDVINSTITLYMYDGGTSCNDEEIVEISIFSTPSLDDIDDVLSCNFYVLQEITGSNLPADLFYSTEMSGGGVTYNAGDTIFEDIQLFVYAAASLCVDEVSFAISIVETPILDEVPDVITCDVYTLPEIEGTNLTGNQAYYNAPNGLGNELEVGDVLTTSQTIYIYDQAGNCSDQVSFTVTVTGEPDIFEPNPIESCGIAILPAITGENISGNANYYTEMNGGGDLLSVGDTIYQSSTIYLYIESGSCTDEEQLVITILVSPVLDDMPDVVGCDSYTLPTIEGTNLSGNEAYFTLSGGLGDSYQAGDVILDDIELFVFDQNSICSYEVSFAIDIVATPALDPIDDVQSCDSYTIPEINGTNLQNPKYYTLPSAEGDIYLPGDVISTDLVLYAYDNNGECFDEESFAIEILVTPNVFDPLDVTSCDSYVLEAIEGDDLTGNQAYYTQSGGMGDVFAVGASITESVTLYLYDINGICFDEEEIAITIIASPILEQPQNVVACDSYVLPAIIGENLSGNENYYQFENGQGNIYSPGDVIESTMTLFIYDEIQDCSDEVSFEIEINETPIIDNPGDLTLCALFVLPEIEGTNLTSDVSYYTGANGTGDELSAGDTLLVSTELFIYDINGDCSDEVNFFVTILDGPNVSDIPDVLACFEYVLPEIDGVNLTDNASYYSNVGGTGETYNPGDVIDENVTIYIYDAVVDCSDEESFTIQITGEPILDEIPAVSACDFYVLEEITGTNLSGSPVYTTETQAQGDTLNAGDTIFSDITLYVYDSYDDCFDEVILTVNIFTTPTIYPLDDVVVCDEYILPEIEGENLVNPHYFTSPNGAGDELNAGDVITSATTLYLFDDNNNCSDEESFDVIFSDAPVLEEPALAVFCDFFILPTIEGESLTGNEAYYTESNAGGTSYAAGDTLYSSITLFIYDEAGSCSSEVQAEFEVIESPEVGTTENAFVCDFYIIPSFSDIIADNIQIIVNGVPASEGDTILEDAVIEIIATNGGLCSSTLTYTVTFTGIPELDPIEDVEMCDFFILDEIEGTNLTDNAAYYTGTEGSGDLYSAGDTVFASSTFYVYDVAGSCFSEETFEIVINPTPFIDDLSDVEVCDFFTLPDFTGENLVSPGYYSQSGGAGDQYNPGDEINFTTTIYMYDANSTCTYETSFDVTTGVQPSAFISGSSTLCIDEGQTVSLTIQIAGSFPVQLDIFNDNVFVETIEANTSPFLYEVSAAGVYTIDNLVTSDDCAGSSAGSATVTAFESIVVSTPVVECAEDGNSYTISFDISGGIATTYLINGELVNTAGIEPFIYSMTFDKGNGAETFTIQDENQCNVVELEIAEPNCECETTIGSIVEENLEFCSIDELITFTYDNTNEILEDDDVVVFALHTEEVPTLGNIIEFSDDPSFGYDDANMNLDVTYYVSVLIGNAGDPIDFDDPCFDFQTIPVVFYSTPTAQIDGDIEDCLGSTILVPVTFSGAGPFEITYTINGEINTVTTSNNPYEIEIDLTEETVIILTSVNGALCDGDAEGTVTLSITDELFAQLEPGAEICNLALKGSILDMSDLITDGMTNGIWADTDNSGALNNSPIFDFDGVTPGTYTFSYTIGQGSSCGEETYTVEIEVIECVCPIVEVEAPADVCAGEIIDLAALVTGDAGIWEIQSAPSTTVIITDDLLYTESNVSGEVVLNFTLIDIDPDCPSDTVVSFFIDNEVSAGDDVVLEICQGSEEIIDLADQLTDATTGGEWTIPNEYLAYYDEASQTFDVSQLPVTSIDIIYSVDSELGICESADAIVEINILPAPIGELSQPPALDCDVTQSTIEAIVDNVDDYIFQWSTVDGNIISTTENPSIQVNAPGTYDLILINSITGCNTTLSSVVEGSADFVIANAGQDEMLTCAQLIVTLDGSGSTSSDDVVYQWIDGSGNVIEGANGLFYSTDEDGMYILMVENTVTGCVNFDTVFVDEVINYPIAEITPAEELTCLVTEITLDGSNSTTNDLVIYEWYNEDGELISEDPESIEVNQSGTYYLHVIDSTNMCEDIDTMIVGSNTEIPQITLSEDVMLNCEFTEATVSVQINSANSTFTWLDLAGEELPISTQSFEVYEEGTYVVSVIDTLNGCETQEQVSIVLDTVPVSFDVEIENPCDNPYGGVIIAIPTQNNGNLTFELSSGANNSSGIFENLSSGDYELIVTGENGCTDSEEINLYSNADLDLDAGQDTTIDLGESVQLLASTTVANSDITSLVWSPDDGSLDCTECVDPLATPLYTTTYNVVLQDIFGCMVEDDITIRVDRTTKVYAPNVFSPNNDGVNETWTLFSADNIDRISEIYVYNRWGEKVWENFDIETGDTSEGWDGTFKGMDNNVGVFAWYAVVTLFDGTEEVLKGDVTIIK